MPRIKRGVIWVNEEYNDMQGPCPDGFHIPTPSELYSLKTIWDALGGGSSGSDFGAALKMPLAGSRDRSTSNVSSQGSYGNYMTSIAESPDAKYQFFTSSGFGFRPSGSTTTTTYAHSIRAFKDTPVIPTSSWTKTYGTSIESGGIFWNATDGIISLSSDGTTWVTIADKNVGATTVWNSGDTLSEANCGKYYQRGNNYGFAWTGTLTNTSTTQVDATNYGPGNYYNSSTYIKRTAYPRGWDSSNSNNLRGGVSQGSRTRFVGKQFYPNPLKTYSEIFAMATAEGPQWSNTIAELNSLKKTYYMNFSDLLVQKYERQTGGTVYAIDGVYETVDVGTMYDKYRRLGYSTDYGHNGWGAIICNS